MELISSTFLVGAFLVGMGFFFGLTGALIPGPMLAYVVSDTLKKGALAGPLTVLGHISVELPLIVAFVVLGLELMNSYFRQFEFLIYSLGGIALVLMSLLILKEAKSPLKGVASDNKVSMRGAKYAFNSSIYGGVRFTAFNPSFIPWWVTIGYLYLLQGFERLALTGIVLVSVGHFLSDLAWYSFISFSFSRGKNFFVDRRYGHIMLVLALIVIAWGVYFFVQGITGLLNPG